MSKKTSFNGASASKSVSKNEKTAPIPIGQEPELDLTAFYDGPADPRIEADLARADALYDDFATRYRGRIATLTAPELLTAIQAMEEISGLTGRTGTYAYILKAKDAATNGAFFKKVDDALTAMSTKATFYGLELAQLDPAALQAKMQAHAPLAAYRTYLEGATRDKPHLLTEAEEKLSTTMSQTGRGAWVELFDQLMPAMKFPYRGRTLNEVQIFDLLSGSPDRTVRADAYKGLAQGLKDNMLVLAHITNTLALDKAKNDELRRYPTAVSARNLSNNIDDRIVDALNDAVVGAYPRTAHRYYDIKRKYLGLRTMKPYDRNATLLTVKEKPVSWDQARKIVIDSYRSFSPEIADIADMFFEKRWIDARASKGKDGGAFSHPMVVDKHPVVFINWTGSRRDVAVLAHELGHGVHQWLAARHTQSEILSDTPLTLAETASIFGEKLVFERLLAQETDPQQRIAMLAGKIDDGINTIVRQIAFFNFEKQMHEARRTKGVQSPEEIGEIFMRTQKQALGPAFTLDKDYANMWSYIPHFIHSPFYVYAYAFGECMVNSLYEVYRNDPDKDAFVEKYKRLLKDGGSKDQTDAVKPFGLDLTDPGFWDKGMKSLEVMIDRLEAEIKAARKPAPKTGPAMG